MGNQVLIKNLVNLERIGQKEMEVTKERIKEANSNSAYVVLSTGGLTTSLQNTS